MRKNKHGKPGTLKVVDPSVVDWTKVRSIRITPYQGFGLSDADRDSKFRPDMRVVLRYRYAVEPTVADGSYSTVLFSWDVAEAKALALRLATEHGVPILSAAN